MDAELGKFLQVLSAPQQRKTEHIDELIKQSLKYSQLLQSPSNFEDLKDSIRKYIQPPEKAQELPEHLLSIALSSNIHRRVLLALVQGFVRVVPDGGERARRIISANIRDCSIHDLLCEAAEPEFSVFVIATNFLNGVQNPSALPRADLARGAAKAAIRRPVLLPGLAGFITRELADVGTSDLVSVATLLNRWHEVCFVTACAKDNNELQARDSAASRPASSRSS
jgi:hypothetical protein